MNVQLKRNDTKDTISYTITNPNGSVVNLTGATVKFIMGKNKTLITNAAATIVNAAAGEVSYTFAEADTLAAGSFNAEFEVTFSDGKIKSYPSNGYIVVNIQSNVDKNKSTYLEDKIALRVSDVELFKKEINEKVAITQQLIDGSFNDGLLKTNIEQKLTNLEIQYAPRLNELSSSMTHKAAKNEVFSMANMGQDIKTAMTGGSVAVVGVDGVLSENIVAKQIKPEHTSFLTPGYNILPNKIDTTNVGYQLNISDGTIYVAAARTVTGFYKVKSNATYDGFLADMYGAKINFGDRLGFYDKDYKFLSGLTISGKSFTTPSNCKFIRFSAGNTTDNGITGVDLQNIYIGEFIASTGDWFYPGDYFEDKIKQVVNNPVTVKSTNAFDKNNYTADRRMASVSPGRYYDDSVLLNNPTSGYFVSHYIPVNEGDVLHVGYFNSQNVWVYTASAQATFGFFDVDKKAMGRKTPTAGLVVPKQAKYFRFYESETYRPILQVYINQTPGLGRLDYKEKTFSNSRRMAEYVDLKDWYGKKWLSYGDSITAIGNGNDSYDGEYFIAGASRSVESWQTHVTKYHGFVKHYGRGVGGSTMKYGASTWYANPDGTYNTRPPEAQPAGTSVKNGSISSFERISTMMPLDTDLVFLFGGTNDIMSNVPIGDTTWIVGDGFDTVWKASQLYKGGDFNLSTYKGALASTILKVQTLLPNAIIVVGTPLSGRASTSGNPFDIAKNSLGLTYIDYVKATKEVCIEFSVPCIDVFGTTGINQFNRTTYITDDVHPYTDKGNKALARGVIGGLKSIIPNII